MVIPDLIYSLLLGCKYVYLGVPSTPIPVAVMQTWSQTIVKLSLWSIHCPEKVDGLRIRTKPWKSALGSLPKPIKHPLPLPTPNLGSFSRRIIFCTKAPERKENQEHNQLVIPTEYRNQVLHTRTRISFTGHMGTVAPNIRISCHYYWSKMNSKIT